METSAEKQMDQTHVTRFPYQEYKETNTKFRRSLNDRHGSLKHSPLSHAVHPMVPSTIYLKIATEKKVYGYMFRRETFSNQ
jgi:hypothetical protein